MAAYDSLLSLAQTLHQILDHHRYNNNPLVDKEKIVPLLEKVDFIVDFLEEYSDKHCAGAVDLVTNRIKKAAWEAQDIMDSYLFWVSRKGIESINCTRNENFLTRLYEKVNVVKDLYLARERINFIWEEAMKLKNSDATVPDLPSIAHSFPVDYSSMSQTITPKNMVVGFDDDLNTIMERLYDDSSSLQIIPIVGMGGIGKTTLARRAYEGSVISQYFDICAWITVSAVYQRRDILSKLIQSFKNEKPDGNEAELVNLVYQHLVGRRYLVVIDDIWSTEAWDDLKMLFPDDGCGGRVMLTTRISDVAFHAGSSSTLLHQMSLLNEDQSWKLFRETIFGQESCPLELIDTGMKIARHCGGLPLTIVVIAGLLLSSGNVAKREFWENISENISLKEPTIELQCSKILCLSYDRLPLRLKPCFLHITSFPEDSKIDVSKLIKLWVAEGFLKQSDQFKCLEDVGEQYLEDLVNRNVILASKKGPDGKLEIVGIHDLLREICITRAETEGFFGHVSSKTITRKQNSELICITEAENEGFLCHVLSKMNTRKDVVHNTSRRLCIHLTRGSAKCRIQDSRVRSVLLFSKRHPLSRLSLDCRRLTILNVPLVTLMNLSHVISTLVNLRYIAFMLEKASFRRVFRTLTSKLPNLQTIVANVPFPHGLYPELQVPYGIFEMPKIRHIIVDNFFFLSYPSDVGSRTIHESNLQTLDKVINLRFTEEAIKILVNLKKLVVQYDTLGHEWDDFNFSNLLRLQSLEELLAVFDLQRSRPLPIWNHAFPISLKKLTLIGVPLPWDNMAVIGSLPHLQVLQMVDIRATKVSKWTPREGQFLRLKYFLSSLDDLANWEAEKEHFPHLESLILRDARWLGEIPCGIGEIDSLQLIELWLCSESLVNSAERIREQQHENGNDAFKVRVFPTYASLWAMPERFSFLNDPRAYLIDFEDMHPIY